MKFDDLIGETGFSQSSLKIDQGERTTFGRISAVFCSFNRAGTAAGIVVVVAVDVVVVVVVITVLVVVILWSSFRRHSCSSMWLLSLFF